MKSKDIDIAIKFYNLQIKTAQQALESLFILKQEAQANENGQISFDIKEG